jgi:hypothetical protein
MTTIDFKEQQKQNHTIWRKSNISSFEYGYQNKKKYEHIVPRNLWKKTLWPRIVNTLPNYLSEKKIQSHPGTHNLLSSWILCANLYFIIRIDPGFKTLMRGFLHKYVSHKIIDIKDTELEFAFTDNCSPESLLGEKGGIRGSGQTSPDVAFIVKTATGKGIILTECKYTERSFYRCSARTTEGSQDKIGNPNPSRCLLSPKGESCQDICHQTIWQRRYWEHLRLSKYGVSTLKRCPASTAGYQLFRQQALAEGIASKNRFDLVVSSVAFDERNQVLINSLGSTGILDFQSQWGELFLGKAYFKTWTHQQWVEYVRHNAVTTLQKEWLAYIHERYDY